MRLIYRLVIESTQERDGQIILTPQQQHYLNRVLRMGEGDRFVAMDGQGQSWLAQLAGRSAQILEPLVASTELSVAVTLMVALPKGNGFDGVVRCCTELGVTNLVPLISDRTLLKPSFHKLERWRRIAQEAAEQSERQIVPTIAEIANFTKALKKVRDSGSDCYICVARRDGTHLLNCLHKQNQKHIIIATGPEGGWTTSEVEKAIAAGFQSVSLGRRILRATTAPIVALSLAAAAAENRTSTPNLQTFQTS
ncbi:MAG: 16S rRNA (uracil(1498)-N(3))-methyltransferase [Xenococcaceae cyanobacterium]